MISVLGLGFVGLTTALGFSEKGFNVVGYDVDENKLNVISKGRVPFFEDHLQDILHKHLNKNFKVAATFKEAIVEAESIFLCVGTPSDEEGKANLSYLLKAIEDILKFVPKNSKKIIVIKSTIPPSTTKKIIIPFIEKKGIEIGNDIIVVNNPEFLREGHAWDDFIHPDRIVIGGENEHAQQVLRKIYQPFNVPIHFVSMNTGEFIKYLSNTLLSTLISYSNEMSMIAKTIGDIDLKRAFGILHEDKRWGEQKTCMMTSYVFPGCGFGGYCLPKDTQALVYKAGEYGYNAKILKNVLKVNDEIKPFWVDKITENLAKSATIGILGLSFKPFSDDIRQTPVKQLIDQILGRGYEHIIAYDPVANNLFDKMYKMPIKYGNSVQEILEKADVIVIATAWPEFVEKKSFFENKKFFDLRYCL